ncbi:MAG: DUF885 domain-containing protein [Porticoccaceae bacterium]|nr:DUF885 domain-containing protein [Porticoccaceae bacterium]
MKNAFLSLIAMMIFSLSAGCQMDQSESASSESTAMTSQQVIEFLDELFMEELQESPQYMTYLGMRERYDEWDDNSDQARDKSLQMTRNHLQQVMKIDLSNVDDSAKLSVKMFIEQANKRLEGDRWRYHSYPVSQMRGVHGRIPSFLINQHLIADEEEAQAYIKRLAATPKVLDQLIEHLKIRQDKNIIAPKFVFPLVLKSIDNILIGAPFDEGFDSTLLADFKRKIENIDIADDTRSELTSAASNALKDHLAPAYRRLQLALRDLESVATNDHGVWKFPDGDKFYEFALQRTTTTDLTANQIHNRGLKEVARIQSEMQDIMNTVGFEGDLQEFFAFMRNDPQFYYPDTAAGKQAYLDKATAVIDNMKSRLDELFITEPKADLIVKAVEPFREASAGQAFYQRPAPDGSRPGTYFANLYKMSDMSKYNMEALAYHEGIPGHHMQISIAQELQNIPKFRLFGGYTVFSEGWGLYSEAVPKEIGLYVDPYSDFGRLSGELYRACRLVVDTGIHAKKWTREDAIAYMNANVPHSESYNIRQIERYIVMPSQATAYKIGMLRIQELRAQAQIALGDKFDIREFHDVVLKDGSVSLPILEDNVNAWILKLNP